MRYLSADAEHLVSFTVNGEVISARCEPRMLLSDFVRETLGLTGTHVGCEHGVCGACTVLIDDRAERACLTYAVQLQDRKLETVEYLSGKSHTLTSLQQAFKRHHALQCGFCTPGILNSLTALLAREPSADEARIRDVLSGHLCRCTGYQGIVDAALEVFGSASEKTENV
jgi:2-furoyl-CoA dehydrogenase 2Fe-2S iron sulfur subunit